MILPAFGIISEVIPVFSRKPIFGYEFVAASSVAIAFLSFTVWAHHMFTVGMSHIANLAFGVASMLIAVPTGIKIFNWTATMYGGRIRFTTAMMFAVAFLITFTIGGLSGISFAVFPLDWQLTDTYYLVAHFHYVLFGGSVFAIFAGFYYWFPKFSGRMMSERIGVWNFWLTFIGFNMTFLVQHILGLAGMPRRVFTYPDLPGWARDESDFVDRRVRARHLGAGVHLEHLRRASPMAKSPATIHGRHGRWNGRRPRRRRRKTSIACRPCTDAARCGTWRIRTAPMKRWPSA